MLQLHYNASRVTNAQLKIRFSISTHTDEDSGYSMRRNMYI